jgi:preprotein translocase subunit SecA
LATTLEARDFRGMDFAAAEAFAKDEAERFAETQLLDAIEENLPDVEEDEETSSEWNWQALAKFANARWGLNLRDRELKREGRDGVVEMILERAREAIRRVDLSHGEAFLHEDFGLKSAIVWVKSKFGIDLDYDEVRELEPDELRQLVYQRAEKEYDEKEAEYPVMASLLRFSSGPNHSRLDRESLAAWARDRFQVDLTVEDFKHKQREEIRAVLLEGSRVCKHRADEMLQVVHTKIDDLFGPESEGRTAGLATGGNGALESLADWLHEKLNCQLAVEEMERLERDELERKLADAVEERFRPEIRRMERSVLLQIVDAAWKDHLLAMDHLRSAIGLVGYAQVDPKVEYKREGMKQFDQMWESIGERVTDLIFRMEQLDEGFVGSTWVETSATHAQAESASDIARQQEEAISRSRGEAAVETIRNRGPRVGRNDPCPCGSGKKYKQCCMRKMGVA